MFTSRAEYRLSLRADNGDQRLTPLGIEVGVVGRERREAFHAKMTAMDSARERLAALSVTPNEASRHGIELNRDGVRRRAYDLLSYPGIDIGRLAPIWPELATIPPRIAAQIEVEAQYAVYLDRQDSDIEAFRKDEGIALPFDLDYAAVSGLSNELRDKLIRIRPGNLGQASRIEGMTPAALGLLLSRAKRPKVA
jgi:tRNA uridine 5-carboxymethylaminomethyl modification enzyme